MRIKEFLNKNRIILAILIAIINMGIFELVSFVSSKIFEPNSSLRTMFELICCFIPIITLKIIGKDEIFSKKKVNIIKGIFVIALYIVVLESFALVSIILLNRIQGNTTIAPVYQIISFCIYMISIGIFEELLFRGTILNVLLDKYKTTNKGIILSIIISSVIFGSMHYVNILSGVSFLACTIQALVATALGIYISAIYLRTYNIYVVIFIHALADFTSLCSSGIFSMGNGTIDAISSLSYSNLIPIITFSIPAIVLLRKSKLNEIRKYLSENEENINEQEKSEKRKTIKKKETYFEVTIAILIIVESVIYYIYR